MGRKSTPPSFLQKDLSDSMVSLIRKHTPPFLDQAKRANGGTLPPNRDLLRDFIGYLAKKNAAFRGIPDEAIVTTYKGIGHIYDILRKNKPSDNEEKMPISENRKAKAKSSESKEPTLQKA